MKDIAIFMGGKLKPDCLPTTKSRMNDNEIWLPFHGIVSLDHLKYDKSWDWLMPVINKIFKIYSDSEHDSTICALIDPLRKPLLFASSEIEPTYLDVFEFIKWYNTAKNEQTL